MRHHELSVESRYLIESKGLPLHPIITQQIQSSEEKKKKTREIKLK